MNNSLHFVSGLKWVAIFRFAGSAISWVATLLVLRFLTPEEYGIVGMAMVFVGLAQILAEFGIGSTIMSMSQLSEEDEAQLHAVSIFLGIAAFFVTLTAAYPISLYYRESEIIPLIAALGLPLLFNGAAAVPLARGMKALDYWGTAIIDLIRSSIGAVVSLVLAFQGAGVWAIVGGQVVASLSATAFLLVRFKTPFRFPALRRIRVYLKYSIEILAHRIALVVSESMPAIIGGRFVGKAGVGDYMFAYTLTSIPGEKIVSPMMLVATPILTRLQTDPDQLRKWLYKLIKIVSILTFPLLVGLILVSELLVEIVFGKQWNNSVLSIQILAIYNLFLQAMAPFSKVFMVTGWARLNRQLSTISVSVFPIAIIIGVHWIETSGLALSWWVTIPIFLVPSLVFLKRLISFDAVMFARALGVSTFCTTCMAGSVLLTIHTVNGSELLRLISAITVGGVVYVALISCFIAPELKQFLQALRKTQAKGTKK